MGKMGIFIHDWCINSFRKKFGNMSSKIFINVNDHCLFRNNPKGNHYRSEIKI